MTIEPNIEHQWLQQLVGEWTYESTFQMGPGHPPLVLQGVETVRSLDGFWVVCESRGEMPGRGVTSNALTLGYDPEKHRYVGTWAGFKMAYLWLYEGELDKERNLLTLHTQGPSMTQAGKIVQYKESIECTGADHRVFTIRMLDEDGQWNLLVTMQYRRKAQ